MSSNNPLPKIKDVAMADPVLLDVQQRVGRLEVAKVASDQKDASMGTDIALLKQGMAHTNEKVDKIDGSVSKIFWTVIATVLLGLINIGLESWMNFLQSTAP